jgi:hypothetical protein
MPPDHALRIHLEYELLFAADLRSLLTDIERAFNVLEAEGSGRRQVRRDDRLAVSSIQTGSSVTLILLGGAGLVALADVIRKLAEARDMAWKSEESKWKAKTAKLDYQEREAAADRGRREPVSPAVQALEIVEGRVKKIESTGRITALQIEIDGKPAELLKANKPIMDGQRRLLSQRKNLLPKGKEDKK